jgi:hypothetical protein
MPAKTYCDDATMAYRASRKIFKSGERIVFDESYRLAHLPLVNPNHPAVISQADGRDYVNGRYEKVRHALVIPIAAEVLQQSEPFQALDRAMRSARFAPDIAWEVCERRRSRLHATLASGMAEVDLDRWAASAREVLDRTGPISVQLKGPFIGDRNFGRIYLPVYPQQIDGKDPFALLQQSIGVSPTRLYVVGYYHMRCELDEVETAELAQLIDAWRDRVIVETTISHLEMYATNDDLALSARILARIPAGYQRIWC